MDIESPCEALHVIREMREHVSHAPNIDQDSDDYRAFRLVTARLMARLTLASPRVATPDTAQIKGYR
jgi:hypothetical protein